MATSIPAGDDLLTIAYCSHVGQTFPLEHIHAVVDKWAINNAAVDVTGAFFTLGDHFLQVLEGPRQAVEASFATIAADPRHRNVVKILDQRVNGRAFSEWSMRLVDLTPAEQRIVIGALHRRDTPEGAARLQAGLRPSELGSVLAKAIGVSMKRSKDKEPVRRLLYTLETILADTAA